LKLKNKRDKLKIFNSVQEFLDSSNFPLLTIDELNDLFENGDIKNPTDKRIAELILDAERDWVFTIHNLNDFLVILEREIDGEATKENLNKLLDKYNARIEKYSWESESINSLIQIFDLTGDNNLRKIFWDFFNRIKK
jgi:hypothetical protein